MRLYQKSDVPLCNRTEATQETKRNPMMCEDILLLMLCLLPPEASARFKSVCSYWNRLISSSPYIQCLHKCWFDHKRVIGFYHGSKSVKPRQKLQFGKFRCEDKEQVVCHSSDLVDGDNNDDYYDWGICATCNGFFLLDLYGQLILRNPVTKTSISIPLQPDFPYVGWTKLIYYGLEVSSSSSNQVGEVELVFQIVNIKIGKESKSSSCFIYSSLNGYWYSIKMDDMVLKQLSSPQMPLIRRSLDPFPSLNPVGATFFRESFHWLFDDGRIFAFDLTKGTWRYIETPAAAAREGKQGRLTLIKNYSKVISAKVKNMSPAQRISAEDRLVNELGCFFYPNIWIGLLGEHIYLLLVIDETNLQLWILDNYDEVEWRIIADIKNCGFIAPLFFDGQRIFVAAFDFGEWRNKKGLIRFFDIFTRKWLPTCFTITDGLDQIRYFFAMIRPAVTADKISFRHVWNRMVRK